MSIEEGDEVSVEYSPSKGVVLRHTSDRDCTASAGEVVQLEVQGRTEHLSCSWFTL